MSELLTPEDIEAIQDLLKWKENYLKNNQDGGESIFEPIPVTSNGKGKFYMKCTTKEWFAKIEEEIIEAHEAAIQEHCLYTIKKDHLAEELTDIITVCVSYLHALGYSSQDRKFLQLLVNAKNAARNYFDREKWPGEIWSHEEIQRLSRQRKKGTREDH